MVRLSGEVKVAKVASRVPRAIRFFHHVQGGHPWPSCKCPSSPCPGRPSLHLAVFQEESGKTWSVGRFDVVKNPMLHRSAWVLL